MPNVRREKTCPQCQKKHRRRGPFCCQGCHNRFRPASDVQREHMRKVATEYNKTPEGIAHHKLLGQKLAAESEDFAIDIPTIFDMPDGYEKSEDW